MNRLLLLLAVVIAVVVLGGLLESAATTAQAPDPTDPCTLLPEGAYESGAWEQDPSALCIGYYELSDIYRVQLYRVDVFNTGSPADAARGMQANIQPDDQTTAISLGDGGYQASQADGYFLVLFTRGPYLVIAEGDLNKGATRERVIELAEQVDENLEALVNAPPPEPDADSEAPPDAADDATDPFVDILEIFAGEVGIEGLKPRINELTGCTEPKFGGRPGFGDCPGQMPGYETAARFEREFDKKITAPSLNEEAMKKELWRAMFLAGMEGPSGESLFPSVVVAMPVIKKLADLSVLRPADQQEAIGAVNRFLELLAARDAARWQDRFP